MELVKSVKKWLKGVNNKMKFDIYNKTIKRSEMGLYADSPQMLKQIYATSDEDIEIVKVYDEAPQNILGPVNAPKLSSIDTVTIPTCIDEPLRFPVLQCTTEHVVSTMTSMDDRFFVDNGVEYKISVSGSYKKSWVDVDQTKFRVVDIETGKESKLKNKKIQTLDWVKIG